MTKTASPRNTIDSHKRAISASSRSLADATELLDGLEKVFAANTKNYYAREAVEHAAQLVAEMEDDLDASMTAAIEAGYGPEDFA